MVVEDRSLVEIGRTAKGERSPTVEGEVELEDEVAMSIGDELWVAEDGGESYGSGRGEDGLDDS